MKPSHTFLAIAIGSVVSWSASADVVTYNGTTNTGLTYQRVNIDGPAAGATGSPKGLSTTAGGTAITTYGYNAYTFNVGTSGAYSFATAGAFDTFSTLYAGSFNAASPLTNAVAGNDDLTAGIGTSGFAYQLDASTTYTYVTSSFLASESGYFSTTINGDGTIKPTQGTGSIVPDPRVLTTSGSTVGGATYNRATVDSDGNFIASGVGTAVGYRTFSFTVGMLGTYSFLASGDYDTFLSLYAGGFYPNQPLAHLVGLNDDAYNGQFNDGNNGLLPDVSAFAADLSPDAIYTLVTSSYGNDLAGFFSDAITGPAAVTAVTAVPEPAVPALLLAGGLLLAARGRRRRT